MTVSPATIAKWMLSELDKHGVLYQEEVAGRLEQEFGEDATYINSNGNLAISKPILDAFLELTSDTVVWIQSLRCWRRREPSDGAGRRQQY